VVCKYTLLLDYQLNRMENKNFEIVGEVSGEIAKAINYQPAKIIANEKSIEHIVEEHNKELQSLGISATDFIKLITVNFNEIRQGKGESIFLIVRNEEKSNVAVVELKFIYESNYYLVMTATPMRNNYLKNKKLLWQRSAPV